MKPLIIVSLLFLMAPMRAAEYAPPVPASIDIKAGIEVPRCASIVTTRQKSDCYAAKYHRDAIEMWETILRETAGTASSTIQSNCYLEGKREDSWGLAMINLPWHPEVTKAQAIDPDFALEFMAQNFDKDWWHAYPLSTRLSTVSY